jgi:hypothetical protein
VTLLARTRKHLIFQSKLLQIITHQHAGVAQLFRALPCQGRGRELESLHPHQFGSLAQLVEQRPEEPCVPSSSLGGATKKKLLHLDVGLFYFLDTMSLVVTSGDPATSCLKTSFHQKIALRNATGISHPVRIWEEPPKNTRPVRTTGLFVFSSHVLEFF